MPSRHLTHAEKLDSSAIKVINVVIFLLGFGRALLSYLTSSYFKEVTGSSNVGVFYLFSYLVFLVVLLNYHHLVRRFGKSYMLLASVVAGIVSVAFLVAWPVGAAGAVMLIAYLVAINLSGVGLDVILESVSVDKFSGKIRGSYLTIMNAGWLAAPLLAMRLNDKEGFNAVFVITLSVLFVVFAIVSKKLANVNHKIEKSDPVLKVCKKVLRRSDIRRAYYISFLLEFFYAMLVIFTPLYLLELGFSWSQIGVIFTVMLVPFVLVQYPAGVLADKKFGEKEMLIGALVIMGAATLGLYFISSTAVWVWAAALFATRIGAALVEILRDSYFFKRIDGYDVDIIDFFRTARPAGYMISMGISMLLLFFFPLKIIFLFVGLVVLAGLYPAIRLQDNK